MVQKKSGSKLNSKYDLIVIGSGAAGLVSALTAARLGASVLVLEASDAIGGTTALSGAMLWVPYHRYAKPGSDEKDSYATARRYVESVLGEERASDPRWSTFFETINQVVDDILVGECGLTFDPLEYPDAYGEHPDGRTNRHLSARATPIKKAGPWKKSIRQPAIAGQALLTLQDLERGDLSNPKSKSSMKTVLPSVLKNLIFRRRGMGLGFVTALVGACHKRGVDFALGCRVDELLKDGVRVCGVQATSPEGVKGFIARNGVILASGGFGWNQELKEEHLPGLYDLPQDPPTNRGDAIKLVEAVDAELRYMDEVWGLASSVSPNEYMGQKIGQLIASDRFLPHTIWVNSKGERFVNEASQNAADSFAERDETGALVNYPAYCIYDQRYLESHPVHFDFQPGADAPEEMVFAPTLSELAAKLDIDPQGLEATVSGFNADVRLGQDRLFGRGDGAYEKYFTQGKGSLGTIEKSPFAAMRIYAGGVGTKGGVMTDGDGRVVNNRGGIVPGLYAAGNASAAFNGPKTVAAGCTITPAMAMGFAAAQHAIGANWNA